MLVIIAPMRDAMFTRAVGVRSLSSINSRRKDTVRNMGCLGIASLVSEVALSLPVLGLNRRNSRMSSNFSRVASSQNFIALGCISRSVTDWGVGGLPECACASARAANCSSEGTDKGPMLSGSMIITLWGNRNNSTTEKQGEKNRSILHSG